MTFAGDTPQLADVKAVDDRYPLYGTLETQPPGLKPQAGSVLLAPRLMALLNLKTGDTIDVGDATLRIAGEVIQDPDAGFNPDGAAADDEYGRRGKNRGRAARQSRRMAL